MVWLPQFWMNRKIYQLQETDLWWVLIDWLFPGHGFQKVCRYTIMSGRLFRFRELIIFVATVELWYPWIPCLSHWGWLPGTEPVLSLPEAWYGERWCDGHWDITDQQYGCSGQWGHDGAYEPAVPLPVQAVLSPLVSYLQWLLRKASSCTNELIMARLGPNIGYHQGTISPRTI